jgi:hypothetical protein
VTKAFRIEKDVKKEVRKLLDQHNWYWWMPPANGFGKSGISDFHALRSGVFMAIETKLGKNKPTPAQEAFLKQIAKQDAFAFVISEDRLEYFSLWLEAFDKSVQRAQQSLEPEETDKEIMFNALRELTGDVM